MNNKKQWNELTGKEKVGVIGLSAIQLALLGAALWDIRHRSATDINGKKWVWTMVSFLNFVGPLAYFKFGRKHG